MNKKVYRFLSVMCCVLLLGGCSVQADENNKDIYSDIAQDSASADGVVTTETRDLFAMDTIMTIKATGVDAKGAVDEAVAEIKRLDDLLSVGNSKSEISIINKNRNGYLSEDVLYLTKRSLELYESTEGAYDITVYPLMELWGFTGDTPSVPDQQDIERIISEAGSDKLKLENGVLTLGENQGIDFGGIAKGYTSARIMQIFEKRGMISGVVSLGGNVHCFRTKEDGSLWRCGITNPDYPEDTANLLGVVKTADKAVITSGGYERFFQDDSGRTYHHIMDLKTGYPAENSLTSVTIVSPDGTLADGLSTSCFVMGEERAISYWKKHKDEFDMILMTKDQRLMVTEGLADCFESSRSYEIIRSVN